MRFLIQIFASTLCSLIACYLLIAFVPISWFPDNQKHLFGNTSITTIQGSDTLSASRTTINNNFSSLNSNKVEISDLAATTTLKNLLSLPALTTVGTITSGTWQATAIAVGFGGTGTTSPTANQIILGNGASGFTVVSGFGTNGQFLTSQGAGTAPIWQSASVDQSLNYSWTGIHNFTGTYTGIKNLNASSTIVIGGNSLTFPAAAGTASTSLMYTANGLLEWAVPPNNQYSLSTTSSSVTTAGNTVSSASLNIPAGIFTASSTITVNGSFECKNTGTNTNSCTLRVSDGSSDLASLGVTANTNQTCDVMYQIVISSNNSKTSQNFVATGFSNGCSVVGVVKNFGASSIDLNPSKSIKETLDAENNLGNTSTIFPFSLVVRP